MTLMSSKFKALLARTQFLLANKQLVARSSMPELISRSASFGDSNASQSPSSVCVFCSSNDAAGTDNLALATACGLEIAARGMTLVSGISKVAPKISLS